MNNITERWLQYVKTSLIASTHKSYASTIRMFSRNISKPLDQLTDQDIMDYLQSCIERGVSQRTISGYLAVIRSFLHWAEDRKLVDEELRKKLPSKIPYEDKRLVTATGDELDKIFSEGGLPAPHQIAVLLMFDNGLRVSETLGLRWGDIDLAKREMNVLGKGKKRRKLPIFSERLYDMLVVASQEEGIQSEWPVVKRLGGQGGKGREEPLTTGAIQLRLKQACSQANLSRNITPHTLRRGFATHALRAGVSVKSIQQALGHSDLKITDIYLRSLEGDIDALHDAFSQMWQAETEESKVVEADKQHYLAINLVGQPTPSALNELMQRAKKALYDVLTTPGTNWKGLDPEKAKRMIHAGILTV